MRGVCCVRSGVCSTVVTVEVTTLLMLTLDDGAVVFSRATMLKLSLEVGGGKACCCRRA
jgi:hypothetical protein